MFTTDNTEGFTARELSIMNAVLATMMADSDPEDTDGYAQWEKSVSDAINNSWIEGMDERDLEKSVRRALGYHA